MPPPSLSVAVGDPVGDAEAGAGAASLPGQALRQIKSILYWTALCASTIGPGSVAMFSLAGARFGSKLVWCLVLASLIAFTTQEAAARLCIHSRLDLGQAIRKRYEDMAWSKAATGAISVGVLMGCTAYEANNFAGALAAVRLLANMSFAAEFMVNVVLGVVVFLLLIYTRIDVLSMAMGMVVLAMGVAFGVAAGHTSGFAIEDGLVPNVPPESLIVSLTLIATTSIPVNLFLGASLAAEKSKQSMRVGIGVSTVAAAVLSLFIMWIGSAVEGDYSFDGLADALEEAIGPSSLALFSLGLFCAAISSALSVVLGCVLAMHGLLNAPPEPAADSAFVDSHTDPQRAWKRTRLIITASMVTVAVVFSASGLDVVGIITVAQVINGVLLPLVGILLLFAVNDEALMGSNVQTLWQNCALLPAVAAAVFLASAALSQLLAEASGLDPEDQDVESGILSASAVVMFLVMGPVGYQLHKLRRPYEVLDEIEVPY